MMQFNNNQNTKKKKKKKKKKKIKHFGHGEKDDGWIHDQRKWNIDVVDIGLTGVQVEDPLQYNNTKPCGLDKRLDLLQGQKI